MPAEPADEVEHVGVAPHPRWEPLESSQGIDGIGIIAPAADVTVDAIRVGPVGLDGDRIEALLPDQPLGDLGAFPVELVRTVRRLADQHEAGVADPFEQGVVVAGRPDQRLRGLADGGGEEVVRQVGEGCRIHR